MTAVISDSWTDSFYELESLTNPKCIPPSQVQITKDLLTLAHSATNGFDHSRDDWPRIRATIDEAFKPPREKLRDKLSEASNLARHAGDPNRMAQLLKLATTAIEEPEGPY